MANKRLTKVEKFILLHTGPTYNYYHCPEHGVFAQPKASAEQGQCLSKCGCVIMPIPDPIAFANA